MSADILPFPVRAVFSRLLGALAGAMHAAWQTYCGDAFDVEAVARLQRALGSQAIGRREASPSYSATWQGFGGGCSVSC